MREICWATMIRRMTSSWARRRSWASSSSLHWRARPVSVLGIPPRPRSGIPGTGWGKNPLPQPLRRILGDRFATQDRWGARVPVKTQAKRLRRPPGRPTPIRRPSGSLLPASAFLRRPVLLPSSNPRRMLRRIGNARRRPKPQSAISQLNSHPPHLRAGQLPRPIRRKPWGEPD